MNVLAFSIAHDSSVAYLENGQLKFFCKEERLSRKKRDKHPFKALEACANFIASQPDVCLYHTPSNNEPDMELVYSEYIRKRFNCSTINYASLTHHRCHAALAYVNSGFDTALVVVVDRNGSIYFLGSSSVAREAESVYVASKTGLTELYKNFSLLSNERNKLDVESTIRQSYPSTCEIRARSPYGLVMLYEAATTLIGQSVLENGKTMGLAAYCPDLRFDKLVKNGIVDGQSLSTTDRGVCFIDLIDKTTPHVPNEDHILYSSKAKHVQVETQNAVLDIIRSHVERTEISKVCVVGGYGLNVVANAHYIKSLPHVEFYFEPCADDSGVSLGAAMLYYLEQTSKLPQRQVDTFYHYYKTTEKTPGITASISDVCRLLCDKKAVAVFEGAPEAGPRALGHRSILFDPRDPDAKKIVNKIKNREWYRPFAAVVLEGDFSKYFHTLGVPSSEVMTVSFQVREEVKKYIPGVVHVDGSCRVQTVTTGFLFDLLTEFKKQTGVGVLLNTSLNLAGEPLVQTIEEALAVVRQSSLEAIFFPEQSTLFLGGSQTANN